MKSIKKAVTGALVLAIAGGGLLLGASSASAAAPPPWEPDPNSSNGNVVFYNAAGAVITGGNDLSHLFDYAVATTDATRTGTTKATAYFAFPDHLKTDTSTWLQSFASSATTFPNAAAPAPIGGLPARRPVVTATATDANLTAALGGAILDNTAGYANIVSIRVRDSGAGVGNGTLQTPFWQTDISFNTAAGTWTQLYPASVTATTTTLTASPNPSTVGNTVTLTATEAPAAAGSVQFKDGAANLGSPVAVNGSGVATTTTNTLTAGSHSLSAVFTPTDLTSFSGSTGTFTATVNPPSTPTSTTLAVSGGYLTAGSAATLTATVTGPGSTSNGAGTVAFFDNGSSTAIPGTVTPGPTGTYTLSLPTGFTAGGHSIVAKFSPTDLNQFQVSQSAPQSFLTQGAAVGACAQPGSVCTDIQNIQATIPVGTLIIDTPYTAAAPLDLGTLLLSADATKFTGSKPFQNINVTDTRAGNLPWTVQAIASNLTDGGSNPNSVINAQNVGLTTITATPGVGFTGIITPTDNPAANGVAPADPGSLGLGGAAAHTVAVADHGQGTVTMQGTLTLIAPSSTEAGLFTGTITFTVG